MQSEKGLKNFNTSALEGFLTRIDIGKYCIFSVMPIGSETGINYYFNDSIHEEWLRFRNEENRIVQESSNKDYSFGLIHEK